MRHERRRTVATGLSGYPYKLQAGLGFGWDQSISGMDETKEDLARKICTSATADKDFGSANMKVPRGKWYEEIHMDGTSDDSDNVQKSVVNNINDQIKIDMDNPLFTRWDNSALGKWFADSLKKAWVKSGWTLPAYDKDLIKFGNKLAWIAYKQNFPNVWPGIYAYLSNGPVNSYKEYLDQFGIKNKEARAVSYWVTNPNYDPLSLRMSPDNSQQTTQQNNTPQVQVQPQQYVPETPQALPPVTSWDQPTQEQPAEDNTAYQPPAMQEPKKESKTMLYVGAGVAAAAILSAIYFLTKKHDVV